MKNTARILCTVIICLICSVFNGLLAGQKLNTDTTPLSTRQQAINFLNKQPELTQSKFWPNVLPVPFLQNIRKNIDSPLSIYEGRSTNFCGYAALSYLPLHDDPVGYVKFILQLYNNGKAAYGIDYFEPSKQIKLTAGTLSFKGELDIRPADQLWFLALADHFKGYLNFFDKHYNTGDENKTWAAVNFAKFNRMVRRLFNYRVDAIGSDLLRPGIRDIYEYLSDRLQTGNIALFVNNLDLYKKSHTMITLNVPTHFIILLNIEETDDDKIAITYWDYGGRTRQVVTPGFLKRIVFGIASISKKTSHAR